MLMRLTQPELSSWWVGLSREALAKEIAAREPVWRMQKARYLDHIGEALIGWREPGVKARPTYD